MWAEMQQLTIENLGSSLLWAELCPPDLCVGALIPSISESEFGGGDL